jgi:putative flippase GtrA
MLARTTTSHQFIRFLAVGVLNTAFGYGCFALLLYAGLHYAFALLASTVLGVLFNFRSTGVLVFHSRDNRLLLRFAGVYAVVYLCHLLALKLLVVQGLTPLMGGMLLVLPMAVLSFILNKRYVFPS